MTVVDGLLMSRPEHVKCENCCYFSDLPAQVAESGVDIPGECRRRSPPCAISSPDETWPEWTYAKTSSGDWCGEFRSTWPEPEEETPS